MRWPLAITRRRQPLLLALAPPVPLPWRWHAVRCLDRSSMERRAFGFRLGVLPELRRVKQGVRGRGTGCVVASRGHWATPFAADAFSNLARASFPHLRRLIGALASPTPSDDATRMPSPSVDDAMARFAARGATGKWRVADHQIARLLLVALSRLAPVATPILAFNGSVVTQSFVRLYLVGNSHARGTLAKFVALMRGMPQHYDRGTHTMVRYVVTTHGDYYLNARHLAPLDAQIPIRLRYSRDERVCFEIVYEYVAGDKACPPGADPILPFFGVNSSSSSSAPTHNTARMSAVLMRTLYIGIMKNLSQGDIDRCRRAHVTGLRRALAPGAAAGLLVQQLQPREQLYLQRQTPGYLDAYERNYLAELRVAADAPRVAVMPPAWDLQIVDLRGHSSCIVLPHFPEQATHFFEDPPTAKGRNCEDRLSAQTWWIFALTTILRLP